MMVIRPLFALAIALSVRLAVVPASPRFESALPATIGVTRSQPGTSKIDHAIPFWVTPPKSKVVTPVEGDAPTPHHAVMIESAEAMVPNCTVMIGEDHVRPFPEIVGVLGGEVPLLDTVAAMTIRFAVGV